MPQSTVTTSFWPCPEPSVGWSVTKRGLVRLLLALVALLPATAHAQAPAMPEFTWDEPADGFVWVGWRLPAGTTISYHEFRFKLVTDSSFPDEWTRLRLGGTPCRKPPGGTLPWQECQATGTSSTDYWTRLPVPNGGRYEFELRAVLHPYRSPAEPGPTMTFQEALPAEPNAVVQFEDALLEAHLKSCSGGNEVYRCNNSWRRSGGDDLTQLDMARLVWIDLRDDELLPAGGTVPSGHVLHPDGEITTPENRVTSIDGLQHALNLHGLNISYHSVTEIPQVANLAELREFAFLGGSLLSNSDVLHLANLSDLDQLHLVGRLHFPPPGFDTSAAVVTDISALSGLTKMRWLSLCDQGVAPSQLTTFVNVERLLYCRNNVSDISPLRVMTNAEHMTLIDNDIQDVSAIAAMTDLTLLRLEGNLINNIAPLSTLRNVEKIHLASNPISDVDTLVALVTQSELRIIDLRGTAVSAQNIARLRALTMPAAHPGTSSRNPAVLWDAPPAAPTGLTASVAEGQATLSWEDPSNSAIAAYQHRYRAGPDGEWSDWEWSVNVVTLATTRGHLHGIPVRDMADRTSWTLPRTLAGEEHDFELRAVAYSDASDWAEAEVEGAALNQAYEYKPGRYQPLEDVLDNVATFGATSRFSIATTRAIDPPQVPADGESTTVDLAEVFGESPAGETPTFMVTSDVPPGVTVVIENGILTITASETATPGTFTVSITSTHSAGQTLATVQVTVQEAALSGSLRGWRLWLYAQEQ